MALVDLTSDLSKFRSEVSREPKSTPEASKATNNKNFATIQPISEKLAQMSVSVKKQEPKKLENKLGSTKLDDIKKLVQKDLTLNSVSNFSFINQDFNRKDLSNVTTQAVQSRLGSPLQTEFQSRLNKSDILIVRPNVGTNNLSSPSEITVNPNDATDNIVNPDIEINNIPLTFDRRGSSPNIKTDNNEFSNNITNPNIQVEQSELSFDRTSQSPNIKPKENDAVDNITNPDIEINRPQLSIDRSATSPDIVVNKEDSTDNITNPNIQVQDVIQFTDRTKQSVIINKDLISPLNNVINPDIALDVTELTIDREGQSPNIITDTVKEGLVQDPNIKVVRIEQGTFHLSDESNLNRDEKIIRFVTTSRLEKFDPPIEVDNEKYNQESIQTDDNSFLNVDDVIKTIQTGRHENPDGSKFSIIGTQQVNFFPDSKVKGFIVNQQKGETAYTGISEFVWTGKSSAAPTTNFITDVNGKGFTKFAQQNETLFDTESSAFSFTNIPETDFFDATKKYTSNGFKSFVTLLDTAYKRDSSVFTFKGNSNAAPTVDYFDQTGQSVSQGFTKFTQNLVSFYIADASVFTWKGPRENSPESNFFDLEGKSSSAGFHRFAQLYDSKYIPDTSQFDWDGARDSAPEVNYFNLDSSNTTVGFHKFAQIYDSKYVPDSSQFDWDGTRENAPEINYFNLDSSNTTAGFHKFAGLYDSKYVPDSSQFDWDGARENAPEINYFNLDSSNTTTGFHKFAQLLDSKYVPDSSQFDWDGARENAPEINYFNLDSSNTTAGFHKFAQLLDSKYVPDSSQFDWDGARENAPEINYFNLDNSNTTAGFHKFAQIYDSKYVKDSSIYDFDGGKQDAPTVNYFDLTNKVSTNGFEKFTPSLVTRYIKDASQYDFDGNNQTAPEVNFFDIQGKHTTKGFEKFPQRLVTKYVKDSSQYDFDGTRANAPVTNFFANDKATGFTKLAQKLQSEYKKDISEFTFKGNQPKPINFFDNTNASGFTLKAPPLESEYVENSSKFTFTGTTPEPVNFFTDSQGSGFDIKIGKGDSKYVKDISEFTFKGASSAAPKTNFFSDSNTKGFTTFPQALTSEYVEDSSIFTFKGASSNAPKINVFQDTNSTGFTTFPESLVSEFIPDISRFTFKGSRQEAPATNYFEDVSANGFTTLAPPLESLYKKETSRFTWNGTRASAPSVNFFGITPSANPRSKPDSISGFDTLFVDKTQTKYSDSFSAFSIESSNNKSTVKNVPFTNFFGYTPAERSGFMVNMTTFDGTLFPIISPLLKYTDGVDKRLSVERSRGQRGSLTTSDLEKYAPRVLGKKPWTDGSLFATLDNQVPGILTDAPAGSYSNKYERGVKDSTEQKGYLAKWATTRRSPSPLDNQYNKYKLQKESFNLGTNRQPYIVRGIQRDGEVENQRWGILGTTFDEGIVRGGAVVAADRALNDGLRLLNFSTSWPRGILFIAKQLGLQAMNPVTDVDPVNFLTSSFPLIPIYPATNFYNPVTSLGSALTSIVGLRLPRHGLLPLSIFLNKYERATVNREGKLSLTSPDYKAFNDIKPASALNRDPGGYNRLIGLMKELLPNAMASQTAKANPDEFSKGIKKLYDDAMDSSIIRRTSTGFFGPQSFLGIGGTTFRRATHPYLGNYNTAPRLVPGEDISTYPDSAKRETFYGALNKQTYAEILREDAVQSGGSFSGILKAISYFVQNGPLLPNESKPSNSGSFAEKMGVQKTTLSKISNLNPYNPKYDVESDRIERKTQANSVKIGSQLNLGPSSKIVDSNSNPIKKYRTANYDQLKRNGRRANRFYNDFRASLTLDDTTKTYITNPSLSRFDTRNIDERYGFGFQGAPGEQRDIPFLSTVDYAKSTIGNYPVPTPKNIAGEKQFFRGDRINIIDYKRSNVDVTKDVVYEKNETALRGTEDLVEFYFTGLRLDGAANNPVEIIVFRAAFDSITDNHNPSWTAQKYMGRADPLYVYSGYERDISFGFTVHIGSRDEMKATWRKLNYLASWTAPKYLKSGYMQGPMCRLNIGHLYRKMPGYISSLSYTFDNQGGTWETAKMPEDMQLNDETNKSISRPGVLQLPKTVNVSVGFVPVGVYRPEWGGVMYNLYDDSTATGPETGLIPHGSSENIRVNYFAEYTGDDGTPVVISGTDIGEDGNRVPYGDNPDATLKLEETADPEKVDPNATTGTTETTGTDGTDNTNPDNPNPNGDTPNPSGGSGQSNNFVLQSSQNATPPSPQPFSVNTGITTPPAGGSGPLPPGGGVLAPGP